MDPLTHTIDEVAALIGVARSVAYKAVSVGTVLAIRVDRRCLVPRPRFHDWLDGRSPVDGLREGGVARWAAAT